MARKKRTTKKRRQQKKHDAPVFRVGDAVRGKDGVMDPDYEDRCIGGWTGTITEIDRDFDPPMVLIAWDHKTLTELIGEEVLARADRQGLDGKIIWLEIPEVERADQARGTQPPQPAKLGARLRAGHGEPLSEDEVRVARLFGLPEDEELPEVTEETLEVYHQYLSSRLQFPFDGEYTRETGLLKDMSYDIMVTGLVDVEDCEEYYGLLCEGRERRRRVVVPLAEIEVDGDTFNFQFIDDYQSWFWNHR